MAKESDPLAGALGAENTGGLFSSIVAEEKEFDRRTLWRLGCWGVIAVAAVIVAVMANQAQLGWRRDQVATVDLARQAQQIQALTRETQSEARRLASAIETLNSDRDRLYSRVTVLEQGLESVTGTVSKQGAAPPAVASAPAAPKPQSASSDPPPPAPSPSPAPQVAAPAAPVVASLPPPPTEKPRAAAAAPEKAMAALVPAPAAAAISPPPVAAKSIMSPPDPAASKPAEPEAAAKPAAAEEPAPDVPAAVAAKEPDAAGADLPNIQVQRTEFAVDLGGANSVPGLRALWRGLTKANPQLAALQPIITVRESNTGFGMQLRLGAGPLADAAAAAKICAGLANRERGCSTIVFDGQRLAMKPEDAPQAAATKPAPQHRYASAKRAKIEKSEEPPPPPPAAKPEQPSTLSSFFGRKQ